MRLFWGLTGIFLVGCGSKPPVTDGTDSGSVGDSGSLVTDSGNQETGDTENSVWSCGPVMALIDDTPTCKELIDRMVC